MFKLGYSYWSILLRLHIDGQPALQEEAPRSGVAGQRSNKKLMPGNVFAKMLVQRVWPNERYVFCQLHVPLIHGS